MQKSLPSLTLFFWGFCFASIAVAAPKITVSEIRNGELQSIDSQSAATFIWSTNTDKVNVLYLKASIRSQAFNGFDSVKAENPASRALFKDNQLDLYMAGLVEKVTLSGSSGNLLLNISADRDAPFSLIDQGCKKARILLKAKSVSPPFFVGTSCALVDGLPTITLSLPEEVELINSSLFESKGKGERWHSYSLVGQTGFQGTIGSFNFRYQKKSYDFTLESFAKAAKTVKPEKKKPLFYAGLGFSSLKITGSDISGSDSKPILTAGLPFLSVLGNLGVNSDLSLAVPLIKGSQPQEFFQFDVMAAYELIIGSSFTLRPKAGYAVFSQTDDNTSISLSANMLGAGLGAALIFSPGTQLYLDIMMAGFGSAGISGHYSVSLSYLARGNGSFGWGLGTKMQSIKGTSGLGYTRQFSQTLFFAALVF